MTNGLFEGVPDVSIVQRLTDIAQIMRYGGITAVLVDGRTDDNRPFEGVSFRTSDDPQELGQIRFADGALHDRSIDVPSIQERHDLVIAGLTVHLMREVTEVAEAVYGQGGDLLAPQFDVLPGFDK